MGRVGAEVYPQHPGPPDPKQQKKLSEVQARQVEHHGYCSTCAEELLRYIRTLLNR